MLRKIIIVFLLVVIILIAALFTPPLDHVRNYILWGKFSIYDFKTHPGNTLPAASPAQPWEIASNYNARQIPESLAKIIEENHTHAFLVIQDGKIVYEKYSDGYDRNTISGSFSVAKSIISMLVGIAIHDGKIQSVDQLAGDYLPHFKSGGLEKIRIKDLLTMSSGTNYDEQDRSVFGLPSHLYYADDVEYAMNKIKAVEPAGQTWTYRSSDTQALGLILEKVYGKTIADLAFEKLLQPMGAEHEAKWLLDGDKKHAKVFCCYNAVARDYARFGELMLHNGNWKGAQLVPEEYMKTAQTPATYLKDPDENNNPVDYYGYQFWILDYKNYRTTSMRGLLGQYVFVIPEKNMVIVRLGESVSAKEAIHHSQPEVFAYLDAGLSLAD
jgi:CubicO group peptidase (beta-lactamase class C family)